MHGPAIVSGFSVNKTGNPTTACGWGLARWTTAVTEVNVPQGGLLPYSPLMQRIPNVGVGTPAADVTDGSFDMQTNNPTVTDNRLRILIGDPSFVLVVYLSNSEPGLVTILGHLTVLTDIDPTVLLPLL